MKKIGFIDYFIDEWHANNYPTWIRERAQALSLDWDVAYAWAEIDKPGGLTTDEWCMREKVQRVDSIEQLISLSDAIIVLSPDYPEHHERFSELALQSGKPVYIDKTFAPDLETAIRIFDAAAAGDTPLFSSSALRFALEIQEQKALASVHPIEYLSVSGPGMFSNYAVHQFEMIVTLMGTDAERIKSLSTPQGRHFIIEYSQGRKATFMQMNAAPFQATLTYADGEGAFVAECSDMFNQLIDYMLLFFNDQKALVTRAETLTVIALIEAAEKALANEDEWISIPK